ncbi:MAG: hypothetical protein ACJ8GJ_19425 [Vitreoscilla sp.]
MKRLVAGVALLAALAGAAASTRPFWLAPNEAQAQSWLHAAADRRDAQAEASLARWSERGNVQARHAFAALLAHRSDAASRQRLEAVLNDGADAGTAHDDARVARLLAQGSAGHVPAASRLLALRALDAAKGTPDLMQAATLMARAAEGGDAPAMFLYANMLRAGQGVERDEARALALYQAAADADYAPAIQALTIAYRYGELGLQADASQSRLMDHEAAEALAHATR